MSEVVTICRNETVVARVCRVCWSRVSMVFRVSKVLRASGVYLLQGSIVHMVPGMPHAPTASSVLWASRPPGLQATPQVTQCLRVSGS